MSQKPIARRIAGFALAAALAVGGVVAASGLETDYQTDQTEEVAGATWTRLVLDDGKGGGATIQGATWS